jgi:hypothetical protein
MRNIFANVMLIAIGGMVLFPFGLFGAKGGEVPGETVYGTKAEQDAVYEIVQKSAALMERMNRDEITVLKESIMPIYVASLYEYAETGNFTVRRDTIRGNGLTYWANTVTADGLFAGNLRFYVLDGVAYMNGFEPTPVLEHLFHSDIGFGSNEFLISQNYADHAKRVQSLTGRESFVPISEVRYVGVEGLGNVFYINNGKTEAIVHIYGGDGVFTRGEGEIVYVGDESLKKFAAEKLAERKAYRAEKAAWEAANPGQTWTVTGGGMVADVGISGEVDNILKVVEYLGIADSDVYFTSAENPVASAVTDKTKDAKESGDSSRNLYQAQNSPVTIGLMPVSKETFTVPRAIAIPIAAFVIYISIKLILISKKQKIKKTESTDSQSDDN